MGYRTATLTADPAPATTILTALEAEMTAVGWVFVEEQIASTLTVRVWKNPATLNSLGQDFYVYLARATANLGVSWLYFSASEVWDTATKLAYRYCYAPNGSATPDATYYAYQPTTGQTLASMVNNTFNNVMTGAMPATMTYHIRVTKDNVYLSATGWTRFITMGLFQNFWASDVFPLFVCGTQLNGATAQYDGATSRRPKVSTSMNAHWGVVAAPVAGHVYETPLGTLPSSATANNEGVVRGGRQTLVSYNADPNAAANGSSATRGILEGLLVFAASSAVVIGDTITVDGEPYVAVTKSGFYATFMKQA